MLKNASLPNFCILSNVLSINYLNGRVQFFPHLLLVFNLVVVNKLNSAHKWCWLTQDQLTTREFVETLASWRGTAIPSWTFTYLALGIHYNVRALQWLRQRLISGPWPPVVITLPCTTWPRTMSISALHPLQKCAFQNCMTACGFGQFAAQTSQRHFILCLPLSGFKTARKAATSSPLFWAAKLFIYAWIKCIAAKAIQMSSECATSLCRFLSLKDMTDVAEPHIPWPLSRRT